MKKFLIEEGYEIEDLGPYEYDYSDDYPDYALKVCERVLETNGRGILICGSAQGVCIAANKIKGIRAVAPFNLRESAMSRKDEDANIICLSGIFSTLMKAKKMIGLFLNTPFSGEARHVRRINKIKKLEGKR